MSMLTAQIDELREAAKLYDHMIEPKTAALLRRAADTIEGLRARLQGGTCHDTGDSRIFHCSKCGYGLIDVYAEDESDIDEQPRFYMNCGAKVVGE